jgi:hypothetical protein
VALTASASASAATPSVGRAVSARPGDSGFSQPYAGTAKYARFAPDRIEDQRQINKPLGRKAADRIARGLGLRRSDAFTRRQFRLFISGRGVGADPSSAKLVDQSVRILTNTAGRPLYSTVDGRPTRSVLASYGLMVNRSGMLQSPANADAPTRQVNAVIEPGGYMPKWCRANGARRTLRALYRSAYTSEAVYGNKAQQQSGAAQLVPNGTGADATVVGMSMAPAIWIVNFALIYVLNPKKAADMPARWAPIPQDVADAIEASPTGQVPYSDYRDAFVR